MHTKYIAWFTAFCGLLSPAACHRLAKILAFFFARIPSRRTHIIRTNLIHCFGKEFASLKHIQTVIYHCIRSFLERGTLWNDSFDGRLKAKHWLDTIYIHGLDLLDQQTRPCILLGLHTAGIEVGLNVILTRTKRPLNQFAGIYMPSKNADFNTWLEKKRTFLGNLMFRKDDSAKYLLNFLNQGYVLNMNADMDFGQKGGIFLPFFEKPAIFTTQPLKIAHKLNAVVIQVVALYDVNTQQYEVFLEEVPQTGDLIQDMQMMSQIWQKYIAKDPLQYWWLHRRFKTQPNGENIYAS